MFNIEKDITKASKDLEAEKRSREEVMRELEHFEDQKRGKRKELAKYLKEIAQCEKKIAERNNRLDKSVSFSGFGIVVDFIWFILLICAGICRFWLVLIKFRYPFTHSLEMDAICDGFSSVFGKSGFTEKVWDYRMHLWTQRLIALQLSSGEQIVRHYDVRCITVSPILFSLAMGRGWVEYMLDVQHPFWFKRICLNYFFLKFIFSSWFYGLSNKLLMEIILFP